MTAASISTERLTCRPEAPIARSIAISRVRWATVIENVLLMMNAPTNTATKAKTTMIVAMPASSLGHRCLVLGDQRGAGDDLDVAADRGLDRGGEVGLRHTRVGGDGDRVGLAGRRQQLGGRGVGEQHGRRPGRGVGGAERGDAGDRELPRLALGEHRGDVARLVAGLVGARLVDDDLVVGRRAHDRWPARTG